MTEAAIEGQVKALWMEMLGLEDIPPEQSFFEAGGDSLQMIDMLFRLGSELGREIDPGFLFDDPSLRGFSALIARAGDERSNVEEGVL